MPAATRERGLEARAKGQEGVPVGGQLISLMRTADLPLRGQVISSSWFPTRRALLGGIDDWIAERERADLEPASRGDGGTVPAAPGPDRGRRPERDMRIVKRMFRMRHAR
ncbi:hypothetical protein RHRU231_960099 [Rhodococcus ruber]|uniref:Uncharacterized protein n=1 Tax=Rhodococcus ruber TaxID=1830 RepID=A0A098BWG8_9NOCA|nr:hypothetical protein RHRU231_960099 [Rhodococcus ruber]